jgi:hypothetical protein
LKYSQTFLMFERREHCIFVSNNLEMVSLGVNKMSLRNLRNKLFQIRKTIERTIPRIQWIQKFCLWKSSRMHIPWKQSFEIPFRN